MTKEQEIDAQWEKAWTETWRPLLLTDGKFDEQKIKNELHDLWFVYKQVSEVYCYITGGALSKPMYYADTIKTAYDDAIQEAVADALKEREDI